MVDNHPYKREYLERPLELHKMKFEALQKRIVLMPEGKTDYEKNEVILEKIKTGGELKALANIIAEREAYYLHYFNSIFLPDLEDLENNYSKVVSQARKRTEPEIVDLLGKLEFAVVGSVNVEAKIVYFKQLKNLFK